MGIWGNPAATIKIFLLILEGCTCTRCTPPCLRHCYSLHPPAFVQHSSVAKQRPSAIG